MNAPRDRWPSFFVNGARVEWSTWCAVATATIVSVCDWHVTFRSDDGYVWALYVSSYQDHEAVAKGFRPATGKTVSVDAVIDKANHMLEATADGMTTERKTIAEFLEAVLFSVDRYKGFSHLDSEWNSEEWRLRDGYDDTRRRYFK